MNRDCKNCIRSKGVTEYDNGCTAWDCDFIPRKEAIKLWESIVHCKDCKHYGIQKTSGTEFPCCTNIIGAAPYREPDDFCSKGERKGE